MDLNDYVIAQEGKDGRAMLSGWKDFLPPSYALWFVNRLGDLFIVLDEGPVHLLNVGSATFTRLAESRKQFGALLDQGDTATAWLAVPLIVNASPRARCLPTTSAMATRRRRCRAARSRSTT